MSDYLVRLRGDHLAPIYQAGDMLTVREQATAEPGQLAIVLDDSSVAQVRYYQPSEGHRVIGLVTGMSRRIPGVAS